MASLSFHFPAFSTASAAAAAASPSAAPMTADDALSVSNLVTNVVAAVSGPTSRSVLKNPQIGDVRTSFTVIRPHDISLVYKQSGDTFVPYTAKNGKRVALLKDGVHDAAEMFAAAQSANSMMCWLVRLAGFLLMFFGVSMVLKPLSVLADVLPILGDIVEVVNAIGAGVVAAACSLVTIAVAWLFYRPVLGVLLIAAAVGLVYLKKKAKTAVAAAEQKAKAKEG